MISVFFRYTNEKKSLMERKRSGLGVGEQTIKASFVQKIVVSLYSSVIISMRVVELGSSLRRMRLSSQVWYCTSYCNCSLHGLPSVNCL